MKLSREPDSGRPADDEFRPFQDASSSAFKLNGVEPKSQSSDFGLPDQFWRWLDSDSDLRAQFEAMIDKRVAEKVTAQFEALRPALEESTRNEGYQAGYKLGMAAATEAVARLETVCQAVVTKRAELLKDHEGPWLRAMKHLLERFMVKNHTDIVPKLEEWISEGILQFEQTGNVKVHLATADYDAFSKAGGFSRGKSWELVEDHTLAGGEIHCECGEGGFVFRPGEEMKKLDAWIDRHLAATKDTSPT